jgi:hypothetical protein
MDLNNFEKAMSAVSKVIAVLFLGVVLVQGMYYSGNRPNTEPVLVRETVENVEYDPAEDHLGRKDSSTTVKVWK